MVVSPVPVCPSPKVHSHLVIVPSVSVLPDPSKRMVSPTEPKYGPFASAVGALLLTPGSGPDGGDGGEVDWLLVVKLQMGPSVVASLSSFATIFQ